MTGAPGRAIVSYVRTALLILVLLAAPAAAGPDPLEEIRDFLDRGMFRTLLAMNGCG